MLDAYQFLAHIFCPLVNWMQEPESRKQTGRLRKQRKQYSAEYKAGKSAVGLC